MTNSQDLTQTLGGKWYRSYGVGPCPVCQPERRKNQNALTLADGRNGRLVLDCKKSGCEFFDILAAVGLGSEEYTASDADVLARRIAEQEADAEKRAAQAKRIWQETRPIAGTLAEKYLRARGITCAFPPTLRFHAACWHGPTAQRYPALVSAVQGARYAAVHRTFLRADGTGKAEIDGAKLMLGATSGGAVRLANGHGALVVAEGIESSLSLLSGLLKEPATVWAALSTSGLRGLQLPNTQGHLIVATDGDVAGRAAGHALSERACALGWKVSLLPAPDGWDWNNVLQSKGEAV